MAGESGGVVEGDESGERKEVINKRLSQIPLKLPFNVCDRPKN